MRIGRIATGAYLARSSFGHSWITVTKWILLHPGEVLPVVLELIPDQRVVWSSFWPKSPDDRIEIVLTSDRGDTVSRFK
jgi:hypothetical protein